MRDKLIEFMDSLRGYVSESGSNIANDERDSSEFVDIFLNQGQTLPIDSVSICVCGTEKHKESKKRTDNLTYCSRCDKPY